MTLEIPIWLQEIINNAGRGPNLCHWLSDQARLGDPLRNDKGVIKVEPAAPGSLAHTRALAPIQNRGVLPDPKSKKHPPRNGAVLHPGIKRNLKNIAKSQQSIHK